MPKSRPEFHLDRSGVDPVRQTRPLSTDIDWPRWLRLIERKRRALLRAECLNLRPINRLVTIASFKLEGIEVDEFNRDLDARAHRSRRGFRARSTQRFRNHLTILLCMERSRLHHTLLRTETVLRWYTSISCGLSTYQLDLTAMQRIDSVVRRISSPQLRLQAALQEIARLHTELMADPVFPSFNGILTRLLLQAHLGNCGLPPVVFDPQQDSTRLTDVGLLLPRLLDLLDQSMDRLANDTNRSAH